MVFAREISDSLTSLVKKLDAAAVKNKDSRMGTFVVFCTKDDEGLQKKLKELDKKLKLKKVVLTIDNPAGPRGYNINKDADVTVVLYVDKTVKVNRAYKKGEFKDKDADKVIADLPKILKD